MERYVFSGCLVGRRRGKSLVGSECFLPRLTKMFSTRIREKTGEKMFGPKTPLYERARFSLLFIVSAFFFSFLCFLFRFVSFFIHILSFFFCYMSTISSYFFFFFFPSLVFLSFSFSFYFFFFF